MKRFKKGYGVSNLPQQLIADFEMAERSIYGRKRAL